MRFPIAFVGRCGIRSTNKLRVSKSRLACRISVVSNFIHESDSGIIYGLIGVPFVSVHHCLAF